MARSEFTSRVIKIIMGIPEGMVCTYGDIAALAGNPRAARQVSRVLHSCSDKENLPWHRVINREGRISLKPMQGYEEQRAMLESEGVEFGPGGKVDFVTYLWNGE